MFGEMRPTGVLYESPSQFQQAARFTLELQSNKCFYSLVKPPDKETLRPKLGWTKSNEPEKHLDMIALRLNGYKPLRILCFSYKDRSLALRLTKKSIYNTEIDYIFDPDSAHCFPEDYEEKATIERIRQFAAKTYDLIIIRHYLEHFSSHAKIIEELSKTCNKNGSLYIEVPSIELFLSRGCPIFLWEQHVIFFTKKLLGEYLRFNNLNIDFLEEIGNDVEPSLCAVVKVNHQVANRKGEIKCSSISLSEMGFDRYIEVCRKNLWENSSKRILAIGAGHNLDRFMQMTRSHSKIEKILDSNPSKHGCYMHNHTSPIKDPSQVRIDSQDHIVLGVHDREIKKTIDHICNEHKCNPTFFSIYQPNEALLYTS